MNKPNLWIFAIEPLDTRYTKQWYDYLPAFLQGKLANFQVRQVSGIQKNTATTPGAFLNFSDTNYWKSSQLCSFLEEYNAGNTTPNDHFLFTDAWNPCVLQLKYMSNLLKLQWKFHGMFHAGSWDEHDFLGREIGQAEWVTSLERSMFYAYDHNYFATDFHINMFYDKLMPERITSKTTDLSSMKVVKTGWPMEYLKEELSRYTTSKKKNQIVFPHRLAPEKQVEIFRDLADSMPEYEFIVCQDKKLSKDEYHILLAESKVVFSASLQETLGISWYEGLLLGVIPMLPDRLSYSEMAMPAFKYPSAWTLNWDLYQENKEHVIDRIRRYVEQYDSYVKGISYQRDFLSSQYFSCDHMCSVIDV